MSLLELFLFVPHFIVAITFAFYIPGRVLLGNQKKKGINLIASSLIVGMVMWGFQGFIFGYLNARWLSYLYLLIFTVLFVKCKYHTLTINPKTFSLKNFDWISIFLILIGTIGQNIVYVTTGLKTKTGILLPSFNIPDHIWHTSLISEMVRRFPPNEPGMSGILVTNYHYWFNLVTAELIRVFNLPLFSTQYVGMYIFGSLMLGITAYTFSTTLLKSKSFVRLLLFFLYFGGDASYWISYIVSHNFDFRIPSIVEYGVIFMDNPPRAFSVIVELIAMYLLFTVEMNKKNLFILSFLIGSIIGFKIYTGIGIFAGLFFLSTYYVLHKNLRLLVVFLLSGIIATIIFIPVNANSGGMFFSPFNIPRDFITYHPMGLNDMELRWIVYLKHNSYLRLLEYGTLMSLVYFLAQYGTKLIGIIPYKKTYLLLGKDKLIFMYSLIIVSALIGIFFNQKAHASDSFNFFVNGSIFLSILAALNIANFLKNKTLIVKLTILIIVIGITIPRWIYAETLYQTNLKLTPEISNSELASYSYLKNNTDKNSLILISNNGYLDSISAIVSIFSERDMFLSGQGVIYAHDAMNNERLNAFNQIMKNNNPKIVNNLLKEYKINYLYLYNDQKMKLNVNQINGHKVFLNETATIIKID